VEQEELGMACRERGAAVSVMWVIFLIVLLLGAGGWIYSRESEVAVVRSEAEQAKRDAALNLEQLQQKNSQVLELSASVGFRADPNADSAKALIEEKLTQVRGRFPNDLTPNDKTLEQMVDRLAAMVDARAQLARDADASFQTEKGKRETAESGKDGIESTLNGQITQLNTDLTDERERAQSAQQTADERSAGLQDQLDSMQAQMRTMESEFGTERTSLQREQDKLQGRVADLSRKVELIGVDTAPWDPDGEVVAVGGETGLVFLDVGSRDLLRPGVRFDVFQRVKGGKLAPKGMVEVREVSDEFSVAGIAGQVDLYNPIAPGDVVANPHFSRGREKVFFLLGTFPGHGKAFLEKRLADLGAVVSPTLDSSVDFLVVGDKEPTEDALELSETPEFKLADEFGIQVLRIGDIDRFLQL
jgi:hypothetical protein